MIDLRTRRAGRLRHILLATTAVTALSLGGSAAFAATTVTPNPVSVGGSVSITPDSACIAAMAALSATVQKVWFIIDSSNQAVLTIPYSGQSIQGPLSDSDPVPAGVYSLKAGYVVGQAATLVSACGSTQLVITADGNVPIVDPKVGATAAALGLGAIVALRKRRRQGAVASV